MKDGMSGGGGRGVRVAVAIALVGSAALVLAAPGFALRSRQRVVTATGVHHANVACPPGTSIVSGGGFTDQGFLYASHKHHNGWTIGGDPSGFPGSFSVVAQANCAARPLGLTTTSQRVTSFSSTATCDPGTYLVSGGGTAHHGGLLFGLQRSGNGWQTSATTLGNEAVPITSYAYCSTTDPRLNEESFTSSTGPTSGGGLACPTGEKIVSGGAFAAGTGFLTQDMRSSGEGWLAAAVSPGGTTTATTYEYCH